jgi:hypothetical protein
MLQNHSDPPRNQVANQTTAVTQQEDNQNQDQKQVAEMQDQKD